MRPEVEAALDVLLWQPADADITPERARDIIRAELTRLTAERDWLAEAATKGWNLADAVTGASSGYPNTIEGWLAVVKEADHEG